MGNSDFKQLIELFDKALTSRDPAVKEQLSKLLMIVALTTPEDPPAMQGPFQALLTEMAKMRIEIRDIQDSIRRSNIRYDKYGDMDYIKKYTDDLKIEAIKQSQVYNRDYDAFADTISKLNKK